MSRDIFNTKDVLGRMVRLTSTQLHIHIIGRSGHIEMALDLSSMSKTVEDPDYIFKSESSHKRNLYYKFGIHKYINKRYVTVVVDYTNPSEGDVITSYIMKTIPENLGRLIYEKSTAI